MTLWNSLGFASAPAPTDQFIIQQGGVFKRVTQLVAIGAPAQLGAANVFVVSPQTIIADADAHAGLVVKGHSATQSANLQEWQTSAGAKPFFVSPAGGPTLANGVILGLIDTAGGITGVVRMDGASNLGINHFGTAGNVILGISNPSSTGDLQLVTQNKRRLEALHTGQVFVNRVGQGNPGLIPFTVAGSSGQSVSLQEWIDSAGTTLAAISAAGAFVPVQLADAAAPLSSLYFSTTAGKLAYKDAGGVVNPLY